MRVRLNRLCDFEADGNMTWRTDCEESVRKAKARIVRRIPAYDVLVLPSEAAAVVKALEWNKVPLPQRCNAQSASDIQSQSEPESIPPARESPALKQTW